MNSMAQANGSPVGPFKSSPRVIIFFPPQYDMSSLRDSANYYYWRHLCYHQRRRCHSRHKLYRHRRLNSSLIPQVSRKQIGLKCGAVSNQWVVSLSEKYASERLTRTRCWEREKREKRDKREKRERRERGKREKRESEEREKREKSEEKIEIWEREERERVEREERWCQHILLFFFVSISAKYRKNRCTNY